MDTLEFKGFIKDVYYSPQLTDKLKEISIKNFDINKCPSCGIIDLGNNNKVAYSKGFLQKGHVHTHLQDYMIYLEPIIQK